MPLIYISKNEVVLGPYDLKLIPEMLERGVITPEDYANREGEESWTTVQAVLDGIAKPKQESPVLMNAPEVKPSGEVKSSGVALPTPNKHNPMGGTGLTSPGLTMMQQQSQAARESYVSSKKNGWVTAILNLIFPGLGFFYLKRWLEGLGILILFTLSGLLALLDWLWLIPVIAYVVCVFGSFGETQKYNLELAAQNQLRSSDDESVQDYFTPIFIIVMGLMFVFLYFHEKSPEKMGPYLEKLPKNISQGLEL